MNLPLLLLTLVVLIVATAWWRRRRRRQRAAVIDAYRFPAAVDGKVRRRYPDLTEDDMRLVLDGLREYFHLCNEAGRHMVSMPSQVVDAAWHEFILFTREYKRFCDRALGRFLHHTPAEAMRSPTDAQAGIRLAWLLSCQRERIAPRTPAALPLLFRIDGDLAIPDGFRYSTDCRRRGATDTYCASHIGCGGCGGSGDSDGCGGDGGGCGGD